MSAQLHKRRPRPHTLPLMQSIGLHAPPRRWKRRVFDPGGGGGGGGRRGRRGRKKTTLPGPGAPSRAQGGPTAIEDSFTQEELLA